MKKKVVMTGLGLMLAATTYSTVFANDVTPIEDNTANESNVPLGKIKGFYSEEKLAEVAEKHGLTVDQLKENKFMGRGFKGKVGKLSEEQIAELAEGKGMTAEELTQEMLSLREAKLTAIAQAKGISVEELKQQIETKRAEMEAHRELKLAEMAEERGITIDELKEQLREGKGKMRFGKGL